MDPAHVNLLYAPSGGMDRELPIDRSSVKPVLGFRPRGRVWASWGMRYAALRARYATPRGKIVAPEEYGRYPQHLHTRPDLENSRFDLFMFR